MRSMRATTAAARPYSSESKPSVTWLGTPMSGDCTKMASAANEDGWAVSIFFEPSQKPGDATVARGFYEERLKRSPLDRADVKLGGDGKKATCTYMIKEIEQKHINVYLVREAVWVDVHISKIEFGPKDQKMLDEIVGSIRTETVAAKK